jgi:hypothetical protein
MSWFSKAFKSIRNIADKVVHSPIAKLAAGALVIVCPPAGAGAMAGLAVADKVIAATRSKDPKRRAEANKIINATVSHAKETANAATRHGVMMLNLAKRRRRVAEAMLLDKQRNAAGMRR